MPVLWGNHNNSDIYINVGIVDASRAVAIAAAEGPFSFDGIKMFRALVDTGAQTTMISSKVITDLELGIVGKILVGGVGSTAYHNGYLFNVAFVTRMEPPGAQAHAIVNILAKPIYGAEICGEATGGTFDVLLGMDVISACTLVVGNGVFCFAY